MQSLYTRTIALKVLDAASETNLEFSLNTGVCTCAVVVMCFFCVCLYEWLCPPTQSVFPGEEFEPKRDYVILAYLLMSLAVYFTDNIHLAVILLHFNIFSTSWR